MGAGSRTSPDRGGSARGCGRGGKARSRETAGDGRAVCGHAGEVGDAKPDYAGEADRTGWPSEGGGTGAEGHCTHFPGDEGRVGCTYGAEGGFGGSGEGAVRPESGRNDVHLLERGGDLDGADVFGALIEAIPGASALAAALSIAGLEDDHFQFLGFLAHKKGRQTAVRNIAESPIPTVLYESPHRIIKLLNELAQAGIEKVSVARELTKMHEEFITGMPLELASDLEKRGAVRGEFVVIVHPFAQ